MATLALSLGGALAGSLIGGPIGGPIGGRVGFLAGQFLGGTFFGNGDDRRAEGPRLTDLTVTSSAYGRPIPIVYGRFRVGGNVVWSPGLKEHREEERVGGKGGAPSQTTVTFRYTADFRVALCEGPIAAILRIWADGKLIADFTAPAPILSGKIRRENVRLYLGGEDQEADPAEQADRGIDDTPAYRGQAGIVFDDLPLEDFGNRIPQITAEVAARAAAQFPAVAIAAFGFPVTQLATWSADRRLLYTLSTSGAATKWDAVNKRQLIGTTVTGGEVFCPRLDSLGNLYTGDGAGRAIKYDPDWRQLGISPNAMSQDFLELAVAGRPGAERLIAQGQGDRVGTFAARTLELLNEVSLADFMPPVSGGYFAFSNHHGMAVDGEGFVWTLVVDSVNGYLFKIDPGIGSVLERHVLTGKNDARFLGYDAATNSLITEDNNATGLLRFSLGSLTVDAALEITLEATVDNRAQYTAGPVNGRLWLQKSLVAYEIDTVAFDLVRSVSATSFSGVPAVQQMVYDAVNHALIWNQLTPQRLHWTFLDRETGQTVPLRDVVEDISARVGLGVGDLDTAGLSDNLVGYVVSDRMAGRAAIEPLAAAYFFDVREEDFKVDFVPRGGPPLATIPVDDVAARDDRQTATVPALMEQRIQEIELPRRIDMTYADPNTDFQTGSQVFQRTQESIESRKQITVNVPIALSTAEAAARVEQMGYQMWRARTPYELTVSRKHMAFSPGDVVRVAVEDLIVTLRIERVILRANGVLAISGVSEDAAVYSSAAAGADALGVPAQSVVTAAPSVAYLLDTPLLRDADEGLGIYVAAGAMGSEPWPGAALYKSTDGSDFSTPVTFVPAARNAGHGRAETALTDGTTAVWDRESSVVIRLFRGSLVSATERAVLDGANALLLGDEVLQFANATPNADGSVTLDTFLRGRRGTEWATAAHSVGERVVLLSALTLTRVELPDSDLHAERFYKTVTVGGRLSEAPIGSLTFRGRALMPYAPVAISGTRASAPADWTVTWMRRTRLGGSWRDGADVPLGEELEAYELDILDGGAVVRTLTSVFSPGGSGVSPAVRQAVYTAGDQISDFGAEQTSLSLRIYQLSATIGRGFPGEAVLIS